MLEPLKENGRGRKNRKLRLLKHTTDREPVVAIVGVLRIDIRRIDVQVIHIVSIVERRRPEVAVAALIVRGAIVEVAGEGRTKRTVGAALR